MLLQIQIMNYSIMKDSYLEMQEDIVVLLEYGMISLLLD